MRKKKIYTVVALIMLGMLYMMIFIFSAENGEESSQISTKVTKALLHLYYSIVGGGSGAGEQVAYLVSPVEGMIRKLAHFTEYAGVGFFSYSIIVLWYKPIWRGRLLVILQLFVSATLDELHQYFVPGRYAAFTDVLIDTVGGAAGVGIIVLWMRIWKNRNISIKSVTK
ncbi:MAG: VanZ family protein [Lachnospiraceae bacterium]|nr:VanZ family protein [Lachnospiraceae bacterium]